MYFEKFPLVGYQFPDNNIRNYKNISIRPAVADDVKGIYSNLEKYSIADGETPETIAYDYYDDANMHWVIMLTNNILNIYRDWPKTPNQLQEYVYEKYRTSLDSDGVKVVLTDTVVSEFVEFTGEPNNNYQTYVDGTTILMKPHHFEDASGNEYSFDTKDITIDVFGNTIILPELFPISHYAYEFKLNETKRNILLPTDKIAQKMKKELATLLNE